MAQTVKNLPAVRETQVQPLGWEDLLEKGIATHSSILAWKIPWTEEPGRLHSMGSDSIEQLHFHFHTECFKVRVAKKKNSFWSFSSSSRI